jgi:hypothetical protein
MGRREPDVPLSIRAAEPESLNSWTLKLPKMGEFLLSPYTHEGWAILSGRNNDL